MAPSTSRPVLMLASVAKRLQERGMTLLYDEDVVALLATEGYDANYGARPLRRTIQRTVEDALSEEIISGRVQLGDTVRLHASEGKITFTKEPIVTPLPEATQQA